jgi:hypothetical protein
MKVPRPSINMMMTVFTYCQFFIAAKASSSIVISLSCGFKTAVLLGMERDNDAMDAIVAIVTMYCYSILNERYR